MKSNDVHSFGTKQSSVEFIENDQPVQQDDENYKELDKNFIGKNG